MSIKYSESETIEKVREALVNPETAYNSECINWTGYIKGKRVRYSEIISNVILYEYLGRLRKVSNGGGIAEITRKESYQFGKHNCGSLQNKSNRREEKIAMKIKKQGFIKGIGEILDYQVPLKNVEKDNAGKIDLLAYDKENNILRILELKKPNSKETLLRCVLEAETYKSIVNHAKLKKDFKVDKDAEVRACPLIFDTGIPYRDYEEIKSGKQKSLGKLIYVLEQEVIVVREKEPNLFERVK